MPAVTEGMCSSLAGSRVPAMNAATSVCRLDCALGAEDLTLGRAVRRRRACGNRDRITDAFMLDPLRS